MFVKGKNRILEKKGKRKQMGKEGKVKVANEKGKMKEEKGRIVQSRKGTEMRSARSGGVV